MSEDRIFRDYEGRKEFRYTPLTDFQKKVFKLYMKGWSNERIAKKIGTRVYTIKTTVKKSVDKVCHFYYNLHIYRSLVRRGDLTKTEKVILRMWKIQDKNEKQIAAAHHSSVQTIRNHKQNIMKKVDIGKIDRAYRNYNVLDDSSEYTSFDFSRLLLKKQTKTKNKSS